jgi:anaphase-promoting complex subunit 3
MEDMAPPGEVAYSPSPPSIAHSLRSEASPSPSNWTSAHEQAAQEDYEIELADLYLYDLTRCFASATRALAVYDCQKCLSDLDQLPHVHQQSPWVLAMVGRAHYEKLDYASVRILTNFRYFLISTLRLISRLNGPSRPPET